MDDLVRLLEETGIPFAYDHFAEGESPDPPFICYLLPQSDNFSADGKVYLKVSSVNIELYTDSKDCGRGSAVIDKVSVPGSIVSSFVSDSIDGRDAEQLYST